MLVNLLHSVDSAIPVEVPHYFRDKIKKLALGSWHTVALLSTGEVYWWGTRFTSISTPPIPGGTNEYRTPYPEKIIGSEMGIVEVEAGALHTCALSDKGEVKCWGWNMEGQLGDSEASEINNNPYEANVVLKDIIKISSGGSHNCVIDKNGVVKCWGSNDDGQLGDGTTSKRRVIPVYVQRLPDKVADIAVGGAHSCAVLSNGGVKCWGRLRDGQLGNGEACPFYVPYPMQVYETCE